MKELPVLNVKKVVHAKNVRSKWLRIKAKKVALLIRHTAEKTWNNDSLFHCGTLSYSLIVAFIPLIASLSLFASKIYELNITKINLFLSDKEVGALVVKFLPYSTNEINGYILKLLDNATTLGWIGTIGLLLSAFLLYGTIEKVLSIPWGNRAGRPLYKQFIVSIAVALVLLITFSMYVSIGRLLAIPDILILNIIGKATSFAMLVLTFTIAYKIIPAARVKMKAAIRGGFFAALLYEGFRIALTIYITDFFMDNKIWGSLILIPIVILSLYILSLILVLGNEMTYVVQNYDEIIKPKRRRQ
ncbi:MAG: YihY/virulence factor BrkB family protein [Fibrobacteres bacterium]|nr:YihY/virulence factor BrkB family protein [Fibrobacterota bacterium]